MIEPLRRYQTESDLHMVTFSCYRRLPYPRTPGARDCFEASLEAARVRHGFQVIAYVVMPEHVHLLLSEPERSLLAKALHGLKLSVAKKRPESPFWTVRYYDFNVFSPKKTREKIRYIHRNPVTRELVQCPEDWRWSSFRQYLGMEGVVTVTTGRSHAPVRYDWSTEAGDLDESGRVDKPGAPPSRS